MKLCTCSELDVVCPVCLSRFARQLGDVPALLAELDVTAARLGRGGSLTGGRSKATEAPLPFHPEAADLAHELRWKRAGVEGVSGRQLRQPAQLYPVGVDVDGRELFRVGEVIDLAMAALARSKARNENRPLLAEASRGAGVYAPNDSSGVGLVWSA